MSFNNEKLVFGKEHIYIVDLFLTGCTQFSGIPPCNATETGDDICFNTLETCNFLSAYTVDSSLNHFRFYQSRSPAPIGLAGSTTVDPIPSLKTVNISPSKIDLAGGLGVRASVSCTFTDHPHSDIGVDKYLSGRSYIASERGSFWTKLRARNPDYQNKELRVLSGYLVDGVFDEANFTTRYYIVDKMTVTNGTCSITAKDPLKLVSSKKAQAPKASNGQLDVGLGAGTAFLTLKPAGIGSEYPLSGKVLINSEVIAFSSRSGDTLTLTGGRGQNNTAATAHNEDDTVQLCLEYIGKQVDFIVNDLITNYTTVDASFMPLDSWEVEVDNFLSGGLSGIIVKPFDVFKLLKELAESMPHYLWWDEQKQKIQMTALKAPHSSGNTINMDSGIVADSFRTSDKPELRRSTIFLNFGQFDPTKNLDDFSNYQQTLIRTDTESIAKYGAGEIKTINSRWITNNGKAQALQLAALIGRRFADIPREISFSLEAKDSNFWVGQTAVVNHRDITDFTGLPVDTVYQILSSKEGRNYVYNALEFTYGQELDQDQGAGDPLVDIIFVPSSELAESFNINLRDIYELEFPEQEGALTQAVFIIEDGVRVGSQVATSYTIDTGLWTAGAIVTIQVNDGGVIVGYGGSDDGGGFLSTPGNGGGAIFMRHPVTLVNNGLIGGGGGAGGNSFESASESTDVSFAGAGGGAGFRGGNTTNSRGDNGSVTNPTNGTLEHGGTGGSALIQVGLENLRTKGGDGGDLGQDGEFAPEGSGGKDPGVAGAAIDKNGLTLTDGLGNSFGDVRGNILT